MTLQTMIYRAIGRSKDTLTNMDVVASAIIDDRCRKADLETVSIIGWAAMMISVEVRRVSTAVETFRKKGFWNEAGRNSLNFETPRFIVRYGRFRPLADLDQRKQAGYKCMDVTVDESSLDYVMSNGMITQRDREQIQRDHGRLLSNVGKRHALTEMILFSEGTSNVKACVHMSTDEVQRFNQVNNPDIHIEERDVMTLGLAVSFEPVNKAVKSKLHWIGKTQEKHDEYESRRDKDKSFVPPEDELGEPLSQLMMMQMREFTRCRHCGTPHRTDRLIQAQVIMKSLIVVDSRTSEDFSVGPKHYRSMMRTMQQMCSIGCQYSQDCVHAEWTETYPAEPHDEAISVNDTDDAPEESTFPERPHRDITGQRDGRRVSCARVHACMPVQGAGKRSNPERQSFHCHMGSSCPRAGSSSRIHTI